MPIMTHEHQSNHNIHNRDVFWLQGIVRRPDGSTIRVDSLLSEEQYNNFTAFDKPMDAAAMKQKLLNSYGQIEESELVSAWIEHIVIRAKSYVHNVFPKS